MAKNNHEWGFMANSKYGDLCQCQIKSCLKWSLKGKIFKMSLDEFQGMHNRGEIDASETLGEATNLFLKKPKVHIGIEDIITK